MFARFLKGLLNAIACVVAVCSLSLCLVASGLAMCAVPDFPTRLLSLEFSDSATSPFVKSELVEAAVVTKDYSVGSHDADALYQAMYDINATAQERNKLSPKALEDAVNLKGLADASTKERAKAFAAENERYVLTPDAISHLDDVYDVIAKVRWIALAMIAIAIAALAHVLVRMGKKPLAWVLRVSGLLVVTAFATFAVCAIVDFDGFFTLFHSLFFAEGTWTFSADSLLICMYPLPFWMGMGAIWLGTTAVACLACFFLAKILMASANSSSAARKGSSRGGSRKKPASSKRKRK